MQLETIECPLRRVRLRIGALIIGVVDVYQAET
jgi:hypothetical protein